MTHLTPAEPVPGTSALIEIHISMPEADAAHAMASDLVSQNLAACVQCLGPLTSIYTWGGEVHQSIEWLLLVKTTEEMFQAVSEFVAAQHRYDVPEVIAVPVTHALGSYGAWVRGEVRPRTEVAP